MFSAQIPNFIDSYTALRDYANNANFKAIKNPVDGVEYPFICDEIPTKVRQEIACELAKTHGRQIKINAMFMRMSPKGVNAPHAAHVDISMGSYSLMLYLNDRQDAGTTFLKHDETGICYAPQLQEYADKLTADQNNLDAFSRTMFCPMEQNKALIFDAGILHCAEPVGGFGDDQTDSRMVLTCFYD